MISNDIESKNNLDQLIRKGSEYQKFENKSKHTWCSGCGDYGILSALKRALVLENIKPKDTCLCYDVGCSGNGSDKINAYTIHGLHGRVTSLAAGISMANSKLKVIASAGDGATFSEGINHLLHSIRNNYNITFICHNNSNYGLTIGQASSTTRLGQKMNATVGQTEIEPLNTLQFVLSLNPSFVARGFSGDVEHMTQMIRSGINHKGFSYIEIMQACPTFNKATPQQWYWDKLKYLDENNHDKTDIWEARKLAENTDKELSVGLIYQNLLRPEFNQTIANRQNSVTTLVEEVAQYPISDLLKEFV
jgi:2-oxoglutarate/2-oxoacid ferredoxin oxidoreductase subunit beta